VVEILRFLAGILPFINNPWVTCSLKSRNGIIPYGSEYIMKEMTSVISVPAKKTICDTVSSISCYMRTETTTCPPYLYLAYGTCSPEQRQVLRQLFSYHPFR